MLGFVRSSVGILLLGVAAPAGAALPSYPEAVKEAALDRIPIYAQAVRMPTFDSRDVFPLLPRGTDPAQLIERAKGWLKDHPQDMGARVRLALAYRAAGRTGYARREWQDIAATIQEAVKGGVDDPVLRYYFGLALNFQDKQAEALAEFEKAVRSRATFADAYIELVRTAWLAAPDKAEEYMNLALTHLPDDPRIVALRGCHLLAESERQASVSTKPPAAEALAATVTSAAQLLERASGMGPGDPHMLAAAAVVWGFLTGTAWLAGDAPAEVQTWAKQAIADLDQADRLGFQGGSAQVQVRLLCLEVLGRTGEWEQTLAKGLENDEEGHPVRHLAAELLARRGDLEEAEVLLREGITDKPDVDLYLHLAELLGRKGEWQAALEEVTKADALAAAAGAQEDGLLAVLLAKAKCTVRTGSVAEGLEMLSQVAQSYQTDPDALYAGAVASIWADIPRESVIQGLQAVLQLDPDHQAASQTLAEVQALN